jgi:TolA-binding protein
MAWRVVCVALVVVGMTGFAQAQSVPPQSAPSQPVPQRQDQLKNDINEMQRDIQQRSREIEQRALNQQREEELYRRQQEERRQREEWLSRQRGQGNTIIIDNSQPSQGGVLVLPQSQPQNEPVWAEPIIPGWERSRIILRGQYWVQPAPRCQLETWMDGRGQAFRRWNCS